MPILACLLAALAAPPDLEQALLAIPDPAHLRAFHEQLGSEPHVAGTPGDQRVIERLSEAFAEMGLEVRRHEFLAWLPHPLEAAVEIVGPQPLSLALQEDRLGADAATSHPDLGIGWNAYSADGDVTAGVVYANYGTKADFEKLAELGVEVAGRIVVARYGGNYRGFKAKFAEQAGALGLIIYTDPDDSGYRRGIPYPEGGWAHESHIQRGSILTLPYSGDPLTPFEPATEDATRLDPAAAGLPRIPVQPLSWRAAAEILSRMTGPAVPDGWQGGLPFAYRLRGGPDLQVRLMVRQDRRLRRSANVLGILPGAETPEQIVIAGCHHDAWGFGASDPLAGTMVLLESARSFAELARRGMRPRRTLVFAAWGAEEYGIIGSTEWCEANRARLRAGGVAYVNLDMAAMGPHFGASASPSLKRLIFEATRTVAPADGETGRSVYDSWRERAGADAAEPDVGNLGGGSDHVGLLCHLGVPACGLGASGSPGSAYHSNHDTIAWYQHVVGDDYEPARMLVQVTNVTLARLADDEVLPLDPLRYGPETRGHLETLAARAAALGFEADFAELGSAITRFEQTAAPVLARLREAAGALAAQPREIVNAALIEAERAWIDPAGLPERPWFRNLFAATDPDSGYAAWMLPLLRYHVERRDPEGLAAAEGRYVEVFARLTRIARRIDGVLADVEAARGGF